MHLFILNETNLRIIHHHIKHNAWSICYIQPQFLSLDHIIKFVDINPLVVYYLPKNTFQSGLDRYYPEIFKHCPNSIKYLCFDYDSKLSEYIRNNHILWLYLEPYHQLSYEHIPQLLTLSDYRLRFPPTQVQLKQLTQEHDFLIQTKNQYLLELRSIPPRGCDYLAGMERFKKMKNILPDPIPVLPSPIQKIKKEKK